MTSSNNPYPGTPIARGPMGGDQYTQVHNWLFRDPTLSAKAKGVFGELSTHTEGWAVTVERIAQNHRDGREAIQTALRELEQHHYVIRHQERTTAGTWGAPVLFVTDLPAQIRALGIEDENLIATKVHEAFQEWRNPSAQPLTGFPSPALTSENTETPGGPTTAPVDNSPVQGCFPSATPQTGFPYTGKPYAGNPEPKKTNTKKTNNQDSLRSSWLEEEQPNPTQQHETARDAGEQPPFGPGSNANPDPAGGSGREDDPHDDTPDTEPGRKHAQQPHTAPQPPSLAGTTGEAGSHTHSGAQPASKGERWLTHIGLRADAAAEWAPTVDRAIGKLGAQRTWTTLTENMDGVASPAGAVVSARLPKLAAALRPLPSQPPASARPEWCGECEQDTRMRELDETGRSTRCPVCHPATRSRPSKRDQQEQAAAAALDQLPATIA